MRFEEKGYADFKKELAEVVIDGLRPMQNRYRKLIAEPDYIDSLLTEGSATVSPIAGKTLVKVKERVGLG